MRKSKRNEVPVEYRRNYKVEIIELLQKFALCFATVTLFFLVLALFN